MTADNIAVLNAVLTLALVMLTGAYVFLTHRLIVHTKDASQENIRLQTLQARLAYFPKLSCRISEFSGRIVLTISNPCDHPAYDVDVFAVHGYAEDDVDLPTFSVNHLTDEGRKERVEPTDEGFFGLFDVMAYANFPGRKGVEVVLDTPIVPMYFHVLIQFRDVIGYNYAQTYWFFTDTSTGPHTYKLGVMRPTVPAPIPRINRDMDSTSTFVMEDKSDVTLYVDQEFVDIFKASFSSGYLRDTTRDVEDRGRWYDL